MPNGTIKFFNAAKKFGFVTPDEGGKDVFVPVASVAAAGISALKAGQRVSFETAPDGKGPKVVNLALIESPPSPPPAVIAPKPISKEEGRAQFTLYHDPACDRSRKIRDELRAAGLEMREVDYVSTPPGREELKRLSMLLQDGDGSLVRKYDPLFHDLRLDDRFISQNEFWDGIVENPTLINGPIMEVGDRVSLFRSDSAVKQFLATFAPRRMAAKKNPVAEFVAPPAIGTDASRLAAADEEAESVSVEEAAPTTAVPARKTKAASKTKEKVKAEPEARKAVEKIARKPAQKPRSTKAK